MFFCGLQDATDGEAQSVTRVGRLVMVDLAGNERLEARSLGCKRHSLEGMMEFSWDYFMGNAWKIHV